MSKGCGSNSCEIEKPTGQGTNGGCMCFRNSKVMMKHRQLKARNADLEEALKYTMELREVELPKAYKLDLQWCRCFEMLNK